MTNRFRWLPLVFALFVGGCGRESEEIQRKEAERAAEKAAKESEESATKQHREEALAVIETLKIEHNATPSWKLRFGPTRKPRDKYDYLRPLTSFEIQQLLETRDDKPFLFVGSLSNVIRKGAMCKCVFSIVLDDEYTADLEFESPEPQARDIITASDTGDISDRELNLFALVVREISLTETDDRDFSINMDLSVSTRGSELNAWGSSASAVNSGPRRVIHAKLIAIAPILIDVEAINDTDLFHFLAGQPE